MGALQPVPANTSERSGATRICAWPRSTARRRSTANRISREAGTVVLDARSKEKYDELHVKGALNLSFPDIALYDYGYTNVYELGPLIDARETSIDFESSRMR
jgi:hypothetical protein